jgi:microcompartment protein CcmL/EutN
MSYPALALLEFNSVAIGIAAGDGMVKRSPVAELISGTVQPGHYLVMVSGAVADVEEAVEAGKEIGQAALRDLVFLPQVHEGVVAALRGERPGGDQDALAILETSSVPAAILAADAGLKGAGVALWQLRLADGLGGKGIVMFTGLLADVETAVELALPLVGDQLQQNYIIPQLHEEMRLNLTRYGRFGESFGWPPA